MNAAFLATPPKFFEEAWDVLFSACAPHDRFPMTDAIETWLQTHDVVAVHATRLTDDEVEDVRRDGLIPLAAANRRRRLTRALSRHPRWQEVEQNLDDVLRQLGEGERQGRRQGQVHATLSRAGLLRGFDHYLRFGGEVDYHAAAMLLGNEGREKLKEDGRAYLIHIAVPGPVAGKAGSPFSWPPTKGSLCNLAGQFVRAWAHQQANPAFRTSSYGADCGLMFYGAISPEWILEVELVDGY